MANQKEILIGITSKKEENFSDWYQQVITKAELLDYSDISGCYVLRPNSYAIWEDIQNMVNRKIKPLGVRNASFPLFITKKNLEKEKDHIEGFAPEVAWVTHVGTSTDIAPVATFDVNGQPIPQSKPYPGTRLEEPFAIRPTSETVIYPYFSKWISSHRDLPMKVNQWCEVCRYEMKDCTPFIRSRLFLWQEGHTAFYTKAEADTEVRQVLDIYHDVYEHLLAVPVIRGQKSEKEKFAGGLYTTTVETFIPATGKAVQGATSHCLGQNFSKMFQIVVDDIDTNVPQGTKRFVWQNSWGLTTRTIGVMIMVHSDNKGLVLPPRVAPIQVVIVPVGINNKLTEEKKKELYNKCHEINTNLCVEGVRVHVDLRENVRPPVKFNYWELRGVPVRLELGMQDIEKGTVVCHRRDLMTKTDLSLSNITLAVLDVLDVMYDDMLQKATIERDAKIAKVDTFDQFIENLKLKNMVRANWCGAIECEDDLKKKTNVATGSNAKSLCIPFDQETTFIAGTKCFCCGTDATCNALFGYSF